MGKDTFEKKWDKAKDKLITGKKDYFFYMVNNKEMVFSIGNKSTEPHTLIVFWQIGSKKMVKGFYNKQPIEQLGENSENDETIRIIVDASSKNNMEIMVTDEDLKEVYPGKFTDDEQQHKLVILQENRYFTDVTIYDSSLGMTPARIPFNEEKSRKSLRNCILSFLGSLDSNIYRVVNESKV